MQTSWVIGFRGSSYLTGQRRFDGGSQKSRPPRTGLPALANHVGHCQVLAQNRLEFDLSWSS
jgi:hypothetical protein